VLTLRALNSLQYSLLSIVDGPQFLEVRVCRKRPAEENGNFWVKMKNSGYIKNDVSGSQKIARRKRVFCKQPKHKIVLNHLTHMVGSLISRTLYIMLRAYT
jgi:hypothetical protein